ncbi:uncharacterized protein C2845_PM13G22660 [Panicum miliaceum]|uniref:Uncharacterized protein n=1 Tax=Panicum miliaceum TaxID=4540 RepID=A0A3L6RH09_PANMI|nr:uncharacterized protein C2845_PM13G22660 [Panicum miliaceum]
MVVLMEEFNGLTLKRKGADEPELFDASGDDHSGCAASRAPPAALNTRASAVCEEESALVLYGEGGGRSDIEPARAPRLPCAATADWVRAMLREADSRTVRELLAGAAQEQGSDDLALAVAPWVPPLPVGEEAESSTAAEEADDDGDEGAAAMDVEEGEEPGLGSLMKKMKAGNFSLSLCLSVCLSELNCRCMIATIGLLSVKARAPRSLTEADAAPPASKPEYAEARPRALRPRRTSRLDATPAGPSSSGGSTPPVTHAAANRRHPRRRLPWRTTSPSGRPAAATGSATMQPISWAAPPENYKQLVIYNEDQPEVVQSELRPEPMKPGSPPPVPAT